MAATLLFGPVAEDLSRVETTIATVARVEFKALASLLEHVLEPRGKRIRPALVLLAAGFNGGPKDRLVLLATAIELLHTATLIHDDMIDGSATRRGASTLHSLVGDKPAILVGDYIFAQAAIMCARTGNTRVMEVFAEALSTICDGELRQAFSAADWRQSREDYYQKIGAKTASLLKTATETGAILSGASERTISSLSAYGYNIGMAFQVVDDVLDFVGDERKLGKPVGSDLRQGMVTLPTLLLLERISEDRVIRDVFEAEPGEQMDEAVSLAVSRVNEAGAIPASLEIAREFCDRARAALAELPDGLYRQTLYHLTDYVTERTS